MRLLLVLCSLFLSFYCCVWWFAHHFRQFLDAVNQLLDQYPSAFEFNSSYLVAIAHHTSSGRFVFDFLYYLLGRGAYFLSDDRVSREFYHSAVLTQFRRVKFHRGQTLKPLLVFIFSCSYQFLLCSQVRNISFWLWTRAFKDINGFTLHLGFLAASSSSISSVV